MIPNSSSSLDMRNALMRQYQGNVSENPGQNNSYGVQQSYGQQSMIPQKSPVSSQFVIIRRQIDGLGDFKQRSTYITT